MLPNSLGAQEEERFSLARPRGLEEQALKEELAERPLENAVITTPEEPTNV